MKLYYFNPNDYNYEYFVMANDKLEAFESLINFFKRNIKIEEEEDIANFYRSNYLARLKEWEKINPLKPETFPSGYTLEEYERGEIVETEIS